MLYCVYHPIDEMRVVDGAEREKLFALGCWFDSPKKAEEMRKRYEEELRNEQKRGKQTGRKPRCDAGK